MTNGNNQWWQSQWWQWPTPPVVPPVTPPGTPKTAPTPTPTAPKYTTATYPWNYPWGLPTYERPETTAPELAWQAVNPQERLEFFEKNVMDIRTPADLEYWQRLRFEAQQWNFAQQPEVSPLPKAWASWGPEQKTKYFEANAQDIGIRYPELGYPSKDPNQEVEIYYIMPDGNEITFSISLGEARNIMSSFEKAKTTAQPRGYTEYGTKVAEYNAKAEPILSSDRSYLEKQEALMRLYQENMGTVTAEAFGKIKTDIWNSLSPEERKWVEAGQTGKLGEYPQEYPPGYYIAPKPPWEEREETVDIDELTKLVSQFGITIMDDYPYLSPITEAHLRVIPQDTLEMMSRYLTEKGLDWRDWLAISEGFYGGAGTPSVRWGAPRQWG